MNIVIVDENDNFPGFAEAMYQFQVAENGLPQALTSFQPAGLDAITVSRTE